MATEPIYPMFAYYYPEGAGYLHVKALAPGTQADVSLVRSCADGKYYVRKRSRFAEDMFDNVSHILAPCRELVLYRNHPLTPRLIDWTVYRPLRRDDPSYYEATYTSTVWEFCDLGDLRGLVKVYSDAFGQKSKEPSRHGLRYERIPEALVWKIFGQLVQMVSSLHRAQPLIRHSDIFQGNIFLATDGMQLLPKCKLGDFGKGTRFSSKHLETERRYSQKTLGYTYRFLTTDYDAVIATVKSMMTLGEETHVVDEKGHTTYQSIHREWNMLKLSSHGVLELSKEPHMFDQNGQIVHSANQQPIPPCDETVGQPYTPELYVAIMEFEDLIRRVKNLYNDAEEMRRAFADPGWAKLGRDIEAKTAMRLGVGNAPTDYPDAGGFFGEALIAIDSDLNDNAVRGAMFENWSGMLRGPASNGVSGPYKIASVDARTFELKAVSERTYYAHTSPLHIPRNVPSWLIESMRDSHDHSIAVDPLQMEGVVITNELDM